MQSVVVDQTFWDQLDSYFPLEVDTDISAHDFALLELSVVVDLLKLDYVALTTRAFLADARVRIFLLRPSFVFDRDVGSIAWRMRTAWFTSSTSS